MLRVNVGLSRKLTRDYNSTGFSINVEGEVCVPSAERGLKFRATKPTSTS